MCMVTAKSDPVLCIVGIVLIIAIIGFIGISVLYPGDSVQGKNYTSSGTSYGGSLCCKDKGFSQSGCSEADQKQCQKNGGPGISGCSKAAFPSCNKA